MNQFSTTIVYQPVIQDQYMTQFQVVTFSTPTSNATLSTIENSIQSAPAKKILTIQNPTTHSVVVLSNMASKDLKKEEDAQVKQKINDKFKEQVSSRVKSILTENKGKETCKFKFLSEANRINQLDKLIITKPVVDECKSELENVSPESDANVTVNVHSKKQLKMPFPVPKSNVLQQSVVSRLKVAEDFYPDPSVPYALCYSCCVEHGRSENEHKIKIDLQSVLNEISKYDKNQSKEHKVYNNCFLRLINDVVSNCMSKDRLCARIQLLLEQPKCVAPRRETPNSQSKYTINRSKYGGRNSADNKRLRKPYITHRSSIERETFDHIPKQIMPDVLPELKRAEKAWKPKRFLVSETSEVIKLEKVKKAIRSLLNKITPTNFDELYAEFEKFRVYENENILNSTVILIFDKAVEEPKFCSYYAKMCYLQAKTEFGIDPSKKQLQTESTTGILKPVSDLVESSVQPKINFRVAIIKKCQKSFGINNEYVKELEDLNTQLKSALASEKPAILEKLELVKSKEKRRIVGTIRFISQLYRLTLLSINIVSNCLVTLLKLFNSESDENYIEYLTQFLETVGPVYDAEKKDFFFKKSNKGAWTGIPNNQTSDNESSYKNIDTDLQSNKWKVRELNEGPKTIEELHKEVEQEQLQNQMERIEYNRKLERTTNQGLKSNRSVHSINNSGRNSMDSYKIDKFEKSGLASKTSSSLSFPKEGSLKTAMKNDTKLGTKRSGFFNKKD